MTLINLPGPLPIIKVNATPLRNGQTLLTAVHATSIPYTEVYLINADNTFTTIGRSEPHGKDDSGVAVADETGRVSLFVSEADPGQSGSTCKVRRYDWPNAVPPQSGPSGVDQYARDLINQVRARLIQAGS